LHKEEIAMKKKLLSIILLLCPLVAFCNEIPSLAPMIERSMPAIVNIAIKGTISTAELIEDKKNNRTLPPKPKKFSSIGSGVIIDPAKGYIVTNAHVIQNATLITITLQDGRRVTAKPIGADEASDIALLQVDAKNLPSIPLGDSLKLKVGDFVVAIGNPFGLNSYGNNQTATFGMISALQRNTLNIEGIENFIQTDAAINPGNSGGALVNQKGELIGINTAIVAPFGGNVGIGFAIPINMVKEVTNQLIHYGSVKRGLMGVFVQHLTPEMAVAFNLPAKTKGAIITQVNQDSPAQMAGLKVGDIITHINRTPITDASQVKTVISLLRVGATVNMVVIRDQKSMNIRAIVASLKEHEDKVKNADPYFYGVALNEFEQQLPLHGLVKGVQITGSAESSNAWRQGLRPGDIITHVNNQSITDLAALTKFTDTHPKQLLLRVIRGAGSLFVLMQ
jgi:serine protease Do